jgi:hypothetical protein
MFALFAAIVAAACGRPAPGPPPGPATADAAVRPAEAPAATLVPATLLSLPVSAYHVSLAVDDDHTAYLLAPGAAHRLAPGAAAAATPIDLGLGPAAARSTFLYWSRGAVFAAPKAGGAPRRLFALAQQPQLFVASGDDFAWLERAGDRSGLHALIGKKPAVLYASPGTIEAVAMRDGWITFVERPAGAAWRIGRVPRAGGAAAFTPPRDGRAPAMLAVGRDIHYYDGNRQEVRRLSPDLQRERTLASGFVCSPIAAAVHVYCAQVEGIFELRLDERPRRLVAGGVHQMVTELAATAKRLLWVVDAGADRLEVRAIDLPG